MSNSNKPLMHSARWNCYTISAVDFIIVLKLLPFRRRNPDGMKIKSKFLFGNFNKSKKIASLGFLRKHIACVETAKVYHKTLMACRLLFTIIRIDNHENYDEQRHDANNTQWTMNNVWTWCSLYAIRPARIESRHKLNGLFSCVVFFFSHVVYARFGIKIGF